MSMKFRPLHDNLLVERLEEDQPKSKGGIIIPDTAKEKPLEGKVLAVGPGKMHEDGKVCCAMSVKVGDRILFKKYGGTDIKLNGKENLLVLREEDVLGVLQ
jgi:chaperonin GroES